MRPSSRGALAVLTSMLSACALNVPREALQLPPEAAADRALQTRKFAGVAEPRMLAAGTAVLQDLGFTIDEAEARLGLVVASKERSAVNEAEVAFAYLMTAISILALSPTAPVYSKSQYVRVALVTSPAGTGPSEGTTVRVNFQRHVFDNNEQIRLLETVQAEELYRLFFDRLSQSVFLEAQSP
jgi:hypothetical protein